MRTCRRIRTKCITIRLLNTYWNTVLRTCRRIRILNTIQYAYKIRTGEPITSASGHRVDSIHTRVNLQRTTGVWVTTFRPIFASGALRTRAQSSQTFRYAKVSRGAGVLGRSTVSRDVLHVPRQAKPSRAVGTRTQTCR